MHVIKHERYVIDQYMHIEPHLCILEHISAQILWSFFLRHRTICLTA